MKRPLLAACALVVFLIALWMAIFPPKLKNHIEAGKQVYIYGQVTAKQCRISDGRRSSILFLSNVTICPKEAIAYKSRSLSDSSNPPFSWENFSKQTLKNFILSAVDAWNESRKISDNEETCFGNYELSIMVYMEEDAPTIGNYVLVEGTLSDFDLPRNPGEFNSRLYYRTLGIGLRAFGGQVYWKSQENSSLREYMWRLKYQWTDILEEKLGKEHGSVLSTILFGSNDRLDAEMKHLYRSSGISHILAISGLHMSLVGMGLFKLFRRIGLPFWICSLLGMLTVLIYGVFTDAGASAYRAAGMFVIRMLGIMLGRNYDMPTSLGVLLMLMVLQNPFYLYHTGFLLSFGAMIGIGFVLPVLEERENKGRYREGIRKVLYEKWVGVKQALLVSFSVTVTTLPIMVLHFYEISPYSLLLNLVVLPLLPILFLLGIILVMVHAWEISTIICALTRLVLNLYSSMAQMSLDLPGSRCIVGGVSTYQMLFYATVLGMLILGGKRISRQGCFKLIWIGIFAMTIPVNFGAEICFLDVGQGDGIFIQSTTGQVYMIDGGSSSESDVGKYTIAPFLKSKGVREIEAWIVTHPDQDHCNGLESVLAAGYGPRVKRLLLPDASEEARDDSFQRLIELAARYEIPVSFLSAGMEWEDTDLRLKKSASRFLCLHPEKGFGLTQAISANEYSTVLYVELAGQSFLLTGDVEGEGELLLTTQLLEREISHVTMLKVAHHGSKYSTSERFLEALDADVAVISCGLNNWYGHPHEETLQRLKKDGSVILTTPHHGAITVKVYGDGKMLISSWEEDAKPAVVR